MKGSSPVGGLSERKRPSAGGDFGLELWSETDFLFVPVGLLVRPPCLAYNPPA